MPSADTYAAVAAEMLREPRVTESTHHAGVDGLLSDGVLFAMEISGHVVVRLPRSRAEELRAANVVTPYSGGGRVSKHWMAILTDDAVPGLMREARQFASQVY